MRVDLGSAATFDAQLECVKLGGVTVGHGTGSTLRCIRARKEIAQSSHRNYHIVLNRRSAWTAQHRGEKLLRRSDALILDSEFDYDFTFPSFDNAHLILPDAWIRRWLSKPSVLAGCSIPHDSAWGAALCSFVSQLTPEFLIRAPLPAPLLADHIGALLVLIADDMGGSEARSLRKNTVLHDRIEDYIVQRCTETALAARDVASALNVSTRTVHRQLAAFGQTFGGLLITGRVNVAMRMLESPLFRRLTIAEIGRRAGFSDASHFSRVLRSRFGRTPFQIRGDIAAPRGPERHGEEIANRSDRP